VPPLGALFGVIAALSFGGGDFTGALASRRTGAWLAVAGSHFTGLLALLVALAVVRPVFPAPQAALLGLAAGIAGAIGLAALYRGMTLGSMGLVTALGGAGSLVPPLLAGALLGGRVSLPQLLGIGFAAAAGLAASGAWGRQALSRAALTFAILAAIGFGAWYVLLDLAARGGDSLWALVLSRVASAVATGSLVLALGRFTHDRRALGLIALAGLLDIGGNAFFVLAREHLLVSLAAALTGLYPIVTAILARLLIGERLTRQAQAGVALALIGILLITLG
jgi:drug/metabolite transporter (DMT)-like permease